MADTDGPDPGGRDHLGRDPWAPVPRDQLPATPQHIALPALLAVLRWALTAVSSAAELTAQVADNRAAIVTLRRLAPERFAALEAEIQPLRHQLLQAELEAAGDLGALGRVIALHKPAIDALGRTRPDLVEALRETYRIRRDALQRAAA